ncbi:hypothetical protein [Candidatus Enterococcus lemimoniae]|uniref:Apea-like HEPN domain-containing protein n=1 Tax=Candidatus Enterococcus lemimoniae TaxID=1834167 RepID=A0ABZ2T4J8_9ENTE
MKLTKFEHDSFYSEALEYWYEEWMFFSDKVKAGNLGIEIVNIRVILLDIINEYELNKFKSDRNRKIYIELVNRLIKKTHIKKYIDELIILKDAMEKKDSRNTYVFAKLISNKISEENFGQILFDDLLVILKSKVFSKSVREDINNITKDLIIDLVTFGVDVEDIKKMLLEVFETYFYSKEEVYITFKYVPKGLTKEESISYIDDLSISERLELFRSKLKVSKTDYLFIFPVWGLIAPHFGENDNQIFSLNVYDPLNEKKFPDNDHFDETFKIKKSEGKEADDFKSISRCNVAIKVNSVSKKAAMKSAEEKYSIFLSFLNFNFADKHKEYYWDGQYIGKEIGEKESGYGVVSFGIEDDKNFRRNISRSNPSILIKEKNNEIRKYYKVIDSLEKRDMFLEANTITNVIKLMSKSIWESEEHKLLNYWICIESLANICKPLEMTNITFIKKAMSNMYLLSEQYNLVHDLFYITERYGRSFYSKDKYTKIPDEFMDYTGINSFRSKGIVSLNKFYERMSDLLNYTTKDNFLDKINDTINFYNNNKVALGRIQSKEEEVILTIDYIYKSRNQIVHNGYVAKYLIPYLVRFAEGYAESFFSEVLKIYNDEEFDLPSYFMKEQFEATLLKKKLSNKEFYTIWKNN